MTLGKFSKEEIATVRECVDELIKGIPKTRRSQFLGEANEIYVFLIEAERFAPNEPPESTEKK
jgi:hypothetical protein